MSSRPITYICAVIKTPSKGHLDNFLEDDIYINNEFYGRAYTEDGMYCSEIENTITIYNYLTSDWDDTLTYGEFQLKCSIFVENIQAWCKKNDCSLLEIRIGSDFC